MFRCFQVGQENLNDATKGTLDRLTSGHKDLIEEQVRIRNEFGNVNKELTTKISENMVALDFEKRIIKEAEHQLSSMAEAIATTLGKRNLGRCIPGDLKTRKSTGTSCQIKIHFST